MPVRILIMGLPDSGKTTLAENLKKYLEQASFTVTWFNGDEIRKQYNDWDFSREGRIKQSLRMTDLALNSKTDFVVCDFVAPLPLMRDTFKPDYLVWLDTVEKSQYQDTNECFVSPEDCNLRITEKNAIKWSKQIADAVISIKCRTN